MREKGAVLVTQSVSRRARIKTDSEENVRDEAR